MYGRYRNNPKTVRYRPRQATFNKRCVSQSIYKVINLGISSSLKKLINDIQINLVFQSQTLCILITID